MRKRSRPEQFLAIFAVTFGVSLVGAFIGPTYLEPMSITEKLIVLAVGLPLLAALILCSRRRARRWRPPDS